MRYVMRLGSMEVIRLLDKAFGLLVSDNLAVHLKQVWNLS